MGLIGVDINADKLSAARCLAEREGVGDICIFASRTTERADVIVSIDAFEHFSDDIGSAVQTDSEAISLFARRFAKQESGWERNRRGA